MVSKRAKEKNRPQRNGHQSLFYTGPAKRIPTRTLRQQLTDTLSVWIEPLVYAFCLGAFLLDIFLWRP